MAEDKDEREADSRGDRRCIGDSPRYASKEHEKGKEVGEGRVGSVIGVLGFCGNP